MKSTTLLLFVLALMLGCPIGTCRADTWLVWADSDTDGPGAEWSNAFHTIQGAVDAAADGDTVLVTNGVYASGGGGSIATPSLSRVCVTNAVRVVSAGGPANTIIVGEPDSETGGCGSNAVRGVLLTAGAELSGFSVTGGWTWVTGNAGTDRAGGGVRCEGGGLVTNCVLAYNTASGNGGGFFCNSGGGALYDSVAMSNVAYRGGGAYVIQASVMDCAITRNQAILSGGGVYGGNDAWVENCEVSCNIVDDDPSGNCDGGGALLTGSGVMRSCVVCSNSAPNDYGTGGGVILYYGGLLEHSVIYTNYADYSGGGVAIYAGLGEMNNCLVARNVCYSYGGGMYCYAGGGPVANCTIVENRSLYYYGGVDCNYTGIFYNCIIYYNTASVGQYEIGGHDGNAVNCCISDSSSSNGLVVFKACTTNAPDFVDRAGFDYHLLPTSPCLDTGSNALAEAEADLDGIGRIMGLCVDMGCYEYGSISNDLAAPVITAPTSVASGDSGICLLTNQTSVTIAGDKNADLLVVVPSWQTNGIDQATGAGQTNWTHAGLALIPAVEGATSTYEYATATADLYTVSSNRTTLTLVNYRMLASVDVTNEDFWVSYDVTETDIGGSNNEWTVGMIAWTNSLGGNGEIAAGASWSATGLALSVGANLITVYATNDLGDVATDSVTVTRGDEGTGTPSVSITNAPDWIYYDETSAQVKGMNVNVIGEMWWVNANVPDATNAFSPGFSVNVTGLQYGDNEITVAGSNTFGVIASDAVSIYRQTMEDRLGATNYVWLDNPGTPEAPYSSWDTAATNIQDAVAAAAEGPTGIVVIVTNGVYTHSDWINLTNAVYVTSVNGPSGTIVDAGFPDATTRCFTVNYSLAILDGFTLSNAYWTANGGGAFIGVNGGTITNCVFTDCTADYGGGLYLNGDGLVQDCLFLGCTALSRGGGIAFNNAGGDVYNCTISNCYAGARGGGVELYGAGRLYSCLIANNSAVNRGGGVYAIYYPGRFDNCTIVSNEVTGTEAGGVYLKDGTTMRACIVHENTAPSDPNWTKSGSVDVYNSATTPSVGSDCITDDPCFVDFAGGDFRLMPVSPCIDAGVEFAWMNGRLDIDGAPRVRGTHVDIGCYESDPDNDWDSDGMPDGWELWNGLNPTNPADTNANSDADAFDNWDEYIADTEPTNSESYFHLTGLSPMPPFHVEFDSSSNRVYTLEYCDDLAVGAWSNVPDQVGIAGAGGADYLTDSNPPPTRVYRVGVSLP
ncbi:MAG: right-handed parallel beta-helix repeat-containing protein [Kiritimatiellae bacterium]|nr:right-handed parallel beta-helix repeat-containing protein [Kiritimatiellia bacterium]